MRKAGFWNLYKTACERASRTCRVIISKKMRRRNLLTCECSFFIKRQPQKAVEEERNQCEVFVNAFYRNYSVELWISS